VYKLRDDLAIIQTIDFFTPIVDDPYIFGQIAVANSLSDVYAMGGTPLTAMNVVCFPVKKLDLSILRAILLGGMDKMREAGVLLVGGHSVEDDEPKYGLSVIGVVHPEKVWLNSGGIVGDKLVLTKPLGTGIINTAQKGDVADKESVRSAIECMTALNKKASEIATSFEIHACTDITGFGFLGHVCEMVAGTGTGIMLDSSSIPFIAKARDFAELGVVPGGLHRNREFRIDMMEITTSVPQWMVDILFDPQTSGGLLLSLPASQAETFVENLRNNGVTEASIVGDVVREPEGKIVIQ
jgi:selenide,water dikinase